MNLRTINLVLLLIIVILTFNIFFPIKQLFYNFDDLGCNINGNVIKDVNLCCGEMAKFSSCSNGICASEKYEITSDRDMLGYCEKEGYNVRF